MNNICRISLNRALVASALVALLVLPCATLTQAAETQQTATVGSQKHETALDIMLEKRIAAGYGVLGPIELYKASSSALVVPDSPSNGRTISLNNKKVTVLDESGNGLTMSSVTAGTAVIICEKKDEVVIYLVKGFKKGTEHGN
jgi:hypothetical protein